MSYINTARKSRLTINGIDESARMLSWTANDDSLFKNGIMRTSGQIVLGTTSLSQYDYQREAYKRGQTVQMELWNEDTQQWDLHPRGLLYVSSTAFSAEAQQVTIEIGCKLALWTLSDNIDAMYEYSVVELPEGQRTIQNISQGLYSSNKLIYQDNTGAIIERNIFDLSSATDPATVPSNWSTGSKTEALSAAPLDGAELPEIIDLEYTYSAEEIFSEQEKTTVETSAYDIAFNAATWVRTGSGDELNSTTAIDGSYSGQPGAAVGQYEESINIIDAESSRTETTTEYYNGPGGQISRSVREVYAPGLEVNQEYFEDQYSACRYTAAVDGDADTTSCSYLQATSPILDSRRITTYTYDDAGTVVSRRVEVWRSVLAAAQGFNWKSGDGEYGQPEAFQTVSLTDIYRDSIVITDYSQNDEGDNVETVTTYKSGAVEYSAGIYASTGIIGAAELTVSEPTSYPDVQGRTSLGVPVTSASGSGTGMTVNIAWPSNSGGITELTVTSDLLSCQWGLRSDDDYPYPGFYPLAASEDSEEVLTNENACALLFWGALPDTGVRASGSWSGGSGSGFDGFIPYSSLPVLSSNVINGLQYTRDSWRVYITGTDFVGPATEVIEITDRGSGYALGDTITWTNNLTPELQFGKYWADFGMTQVFASDYGQSLNSTTITATVTGVNLIKPLITIADPGTGYVIGDNLKVAAADLTASLGISVDQDILFTVVSGEDGITDLGDGIASLSQTDYVPPTGSGATDQYASTSGSTFFDLRYTESTPYPSTINSVGGYVSYTGAFTGVAPEGENVVKACQITPFSVRNGGLMILDNGWLRSSAIASSYLIPLYGGNRGSSSPKWCWESWVYVDRMSPDGMCIMHMGTSGTPITTANYGYPTYSNWMAGNSDGFGIYLRGGNINVMNLRCNYVEFQADNTNMFYPGVGSVAYPTNQWFHLAITADNITQSVVANHGRFKIYIDGTKQLEWSREEGNENRSVYIFTGAGGFDPAYLVGADSAYSTAAIPPTNAGTDYLRVALSQTRLMLGSYVYGANFTPIATDVAVDTGTFRAGEYEGITLVPTSGVGKAATANLEVITGGGSGAGGTGWDVCFASPALPYIEDIGEVTPSGGSGSGMKLNLGIGYSGESYTGKSPVVVRNVADSGAGYVNGDVLTISAADIQGLLANYGGGTVDNSMRISISPSAAGFEVGCWLFPDVTGTQFAVGDTVKATRSAVQAAGAGDPEQDLTVTVTAVTPTKPLQNLSLDAIDGVRRVVVNTSKTDSNLPDNPDSNATPELQTLTSTLDSAIRLNAYEPSFGGIPDEIKESLQVPSEYKTTIDVADFVNDYSHYLKNFVIGEGYGLRIGEAMRDEIMTSWTPMAGLRYTDERISETFAMRADAASWGVSSDEAAVVYNGIWLGEDVVLSSLGDTIDGGNFTSNTTSAADSDRYDGGDYTAGSAVTDNTDLITGGNFNTGSTAGGGYLEVGKVLTASLGLSFSETTTFALPFAAGTTLPLSADWEGVALTEAVAASGDTHEYSAGSYSLNMYHDSSDGITVLAPLFNDSTSADKVTSVTFTYEAKLPASIENAFKGCSSLTRLSFDSSADLNSLKTFDYAFQGCSSLISFPLLTGYRNTDVSFFSAWRDCTSLKTFPVGFFDNVTSWRDGTALENSFYNCALSAQSIQNILVSLDTATAGDNRLDLRDGTNASYSTWSTTAIDACNSLISKGWIIRYNA